MLGDIVDERAAGHGPIGIEATEAPFIVPPPKCGGVLVAMNTATKVYESDDQGVVHVDVPIGRPGQRVEVLVVWEDVGESDGLDQEGSGMAALVGLLEHVDLERPAQGEYEHRDPIA